MPRAPIACISWRLAFSGATLAGAAFAGSMLVATPAAAGYNASFPYCDKNVDSVIRCTHVSWQECQFTAQGQGYCFANPYYGGRGAYAYYPRGGYVGGY